MLRSVKTVAALAAASAMLCAGDAAARALQCSDLNSPRSDTFSTFVEVGISMNAGESLSFTVLSGGTVNFTVPRAVTVAPGQTGTFTAATTGLFFISGTATAGGTASLSCGILPPSQSGPNPVSQTINNAQAAINAGQQTLQSFSMWVAHGVMGSFGLINNYGSDRGTPSGPGSQAPGPRASQQAMTPLRRLQQLKREEMALREERQDRPGDPELDQRLATVRRDLAFARVTAEVSPDGGTERGDRRFSAPVQERTAMAEAEQQRRVMAAETAPTADGERKPAPPTAFSLGSRDLIEMCDSELGQFNPATEILGRKWNVWLEGRVVGAWDSLAQTNASGFAGSAGVDYKFKPWLAVGMSVGVETYETKFGFNGVRLGSVGLSAVPYVGFRLSDNVFASAFVGLTQLTYNSNPQLGSTANYTALRVMFGGSLFGNWQAGDWSIRPILSGTYGSEAQAGYTDSLGNVVPGQTVSYGRLSAGPEVGYTFHAPDNSWAVKPYVLAKANLDFASSNSSLLQGQSVVLRPGTLGSGSAGLGVDSRFPSGFYLRVEGSYDSIGVSGLDVLTGLIRGGMTF